MDLFGSSLVLPHVVGRYSPLPGGGEAHKELAGIWHHLLDEHLLVITLTIGTWAGRGRVRASWGLQCHQTPPHQPFPIANSQTQSLPLGHAQHSRGRESQGFTRINRREKEPDQCRRSRGISGSTEVNGRSGEARGKVN